MTLHTPSTDAPLARRLLQLGIALFLLGLLTGFLLPMMANPRVGLSSHLEGVLNGMFLLALGLMWPQLSLGTGARKAAFGFAVYGTYANWLATLLAGFWGAGGRMMPIAAGGHAGTAAQEGLIAFALISLSLSMLVVGALALWGLRSAPARRNTDAPAAGPQPAA
uniref:Hydroxylaminobenzene mutase n=1 Tax=Pseudomonas putida TaxID=303 RepID=Q9AH35_PSEPU|nr:hydroxylaminobenzene mutase [Pseudomonas putida]